MLTNRIMMKFEVSDHGFQLVILQGHHPEDRVQHM